MYVQSSPKVNSADHKRVLKKMEDTFHLVDKTSEDGSRAASESDCSSVLMVDSPSEWDSPSNVIDLTNSLNRSDRVLMKRIPRKRNTDITGSLSSKSRYVLLLPLFRIPRFETGIIWTGNFRRAPTFVFSQWSITHRVESAEKLARLFNLSFKLVRAECKLLRCVLTTHGFQESDLPFGKFNLLWMGSHIRPSHMRLLSDFHKVNHFPKSYELTRKDRLAKNVQRMQRIKGIAQFDFVPPSFVLPGEFRDLCADFMHFNGAYIVKPIASSRGRGIFIVSHPNEVPYDEPIIVSRYISNPLLLDGFKFDVRLYVAVTSYEPLLVYVYEEGLVRFATVRYQPGAGHLSTQCMHLTNYSVNKRNFEFVQNDDSNVEDYGNKWSLGALLRYLKSEGADVAGLMLRIEEIVIKSFISVLQPICSPSAAGFQPCRSRCFELYGFDIIVDENYRPWLLEVNLSPSLACDSPLDFKVKSHMLTDLLNLVGITCHDPERKTQGGSDCSLHMTAAGNVIVPPQAPNCFVSASDHIAAFGRSDINAEQSPKHWSSSVHLDKLQTNVCMNPTKGLTGTYVSHLVPAKVNAQEVRLIQRLQEEASRAGGWLRLIPNSEVWEQYASLWPREFQQHDTNPNGQPSSDRSSRSDSFFGKNRIVPNYLVESAFSAARASAILNNLSHTALCHDEVDRQGEDLYLHPNTTSIPVNLSQYLHWEMEQPDSIEHLCCQRLPHFKAYNKTRLPLHNMSHSHLQQCLYSPIETPYSTFLTKEHCQRTTMCYALTLQRMPFYLRKLGAVPVRIGGVDMRAQCRHKPPIQMEFSVSTTPTPIPRKSNQPVIEMPSPKPRETVRSSSLKPATIALSANNSVSTMADKLSVVQARHLLANYLSKVLSRLRMELSDSSTSSRSGTVPSMDRRRSNQIDRLIRFIIRASQSLTTGVVDSIGHISTTVTGGAGDFCWNNLRIDSSLFHKQSLMEKKRILVRMLDRFIRIFQYETVSLFAQYGTGTDESAHGLNPTEFCQCLHQASEEDLQTILARYAQLHCSHEAEVTVSLANERPREHTTHFCQNSAQAFMADSPTYSSGPISSECRAPTTEAHSEQLMLPKPAISTAAVMEKLQKYPNLFLCCIRQRTDSPAFDDDKKRNLEPPVIKSESQRDTSTKPMLSPSVELVLNANSNEPSRQSIRGDVLVEKTNQSCQTKRPRKRGRRRRTQSRSITKYPMIYSTHSVSSHRTHSKSSSRMSVPPSHRPLVPLLRVSSCRRPPSTTSSHRIYPGRTTSKVGGRRASHSVESKRPSCETQSIRSSLRKPKSCGSHRSVSSIHSRRPLNLSTNNCCQSGSLPLTLIHLN